MTNINSQLKKFLDEYEPILRELNPALMSAIAYRIGKDLHADDEFRFQLTSSYAYDLLDFFNLILTCPPDNQFFCSLKSRLDEFKTILNEGKDPYFYYSDDTKFKPKFAIHTR